MMVTLCLGAMTKQGRKNIISKQRGQQDLLESLTLVTLKISWSLVQNSTCEPLYLGSWPMMAICTGVRTGTCLKQVPFTGGRRDYSCLGRMFDDDIEVQNHCTTTVLECYMLWWVVLRLVSRVCSAINECRLWFCNPSKALRWYETRFRKEQQGLRFAFPCLPNAIATGMSAIA